MSNKAQRRTELLRKLHSTAARQYAERHKAPAPWTIKPSVKK